MKITIVITTYNRSTLLKRAIGSVLSQRDDCEVVVVDDCSTDDTEELMRQYFSSFDIVYLRHNRNLGVNSARNTGIKYSTGEWIAFLDDDDEFLFTAVNTIKRHLLSMPDNYSVAYFNSIIDNGKTKITGGFQFKDDIQYYDPTYEETMTKFNLKGDCKPVFRKALFASGKYSFPSSVNGYESYLMGLLARDGVGIRYFREQTTLVHFDNTSRHLSYSGPRKNPWALFLLQRKQLCEHYFFFIKHPYIFTKKIYGMIKLLIRSVYFLNKILH